MIMKKKLNTKQNIHIHLNLWQLLYTILGSLFFANFNGLSKILSRDRSVTTRPWNKLDIPSKRLKLFFYKKLIKKCCDLSSVPKMRFFGLLLIPLLGLNYAVARKNFFFKRL